MIQLNLKNLSAIMIVFLSYHVHTSHPNKSGLGSARKLSESLILTVKEEYESFKTSQQKSAPLGFGSAPGYAPPPPGMVCVHMHACVCVGTPSFILISCNQSSCFQCPLPVCVRVW